MRRHGMRGSLFAATLACWCVAAECPAAPPDLTIVSAGVSQVSPDAVQFWMELSAPPEAKPTPYERTYIWFVDTDRNAGTGQNHGAVGSEFNVRVVYGAGGQYVGGWIDGIDGRPGGQGVPHISGKKVLLRVRLNQLGGSSAFNWNCAAFSADGHAESDAARAFEAMWTPPAAGVPVRVVVEPFISLSRGRTSATPKVWAWDAGGSPISLGGHVVTLSAMPAGAMTASGDALQAVLQQASPGVFSAAVDGVVSANTGQVMVGSLDLCPAIQHLNPNLNNIGQIVLEARDAAGTDIPREGHSVAYHMNGSGTISLTEDGVITALPGGAGKGEWAWAEWDGCRAVNSVLVRVMSGDLSVPDTVSAAGQHVTIWYPSYPDTAAPALRFGRAIEDQHILAAMDRIYERQHEITGATPWTGGKQHVALVCNDTQYSVCGGSGNAVQYGFQLSGPGCFLIGDSGVPHWGVISHELAHNHFGELRYLNQVLCDWQIGAQTATAYGEGLTTIIALASRRAILDSAGHDGLPPVVTDAWTNPDVYDSLPFARRNYVDGDLAAYTSAGSRYAEDFNPSVLDGMLMLLADDYGWGLFRRFCSIFSPGDEDLGFSADTETKRATFFVAAMSAAARADLRTRFRNWGFPLDDSAFSALLPMLQKRVSPGWDRRDDVVTALRLAGGLLSGATPGLDLASGDRAPDTPDGLITVADAVRAVRLAAGLD